MQLVRQNIERLERWYPHLFLEPHLVAAVTVLSDYSVSPATFLVQGENIAQLATLEDEFRLKLNWRHGAQAKAERLRATMQRKPLVELAATAVALMIARRILDLGELDVTAYGDRADFRSARRRCVLEISGTELETELERRHREKVAQALRNPFGWDAYVVVCLFSPNGHHIRISRHEFVDDSNE
jgi:hypothetical protein